MFIRASTANIEVAQVWQRPSQEWLDNYRGVPAAIVGDVLDRMTAMDGGIRPMATPAAMVGFALPVGVRSGDNLAIHRAMDEAQPHDVLVVNGHGDITRALLGDLLGEIVTAAGAVGAVVDGAVRDAEVLQEQGLTVYARAATPAGPFKNGPGSVGLPVAVGGIVVEAGDLVIGDGDGVTIVPQRKIESTYERVAAQLAMEDELRTTIRATRQGAL